MRTVVRRRSGSTRLLMTLGLFLMLAAPGTSAYFIDAVPVSGTTLSAAKVDLKVQGLDSLTYTSMNAPAMAPGGSTAGVLTVTNAGSVFLWEGLRFRVMEADARHLVRVRVDKASADCDSWADVELARQRAADEMINLPANALGAG